MVLCPGAPEGSTGSGSGFKVPQRTGARLKVSSDIVEPDWLMIVHLACFNPLYTNGFFLYISWGVRLYFSKHFVTFCLKLFFTFTNSVDPDEMQQNVAFHLGLHCLQNYSFVGFPE